jgi:hypothetical protein
MIEKVLELIKNAKPHEVEKGFTTASFMIKTQNYIFETTYDLGNPGEDYPNISIYDRYRVRIYNQEDTSELLKEFIWENKKDDKRIKDCYQVLNEKYIEAEENRKNESEEQKEKRRYEKEREEEQKRIKKERKRKNDLEKLEKFLS